MYEYIEREEIRRAYEKLTRSYVNGNPYIADWRFDEMIEELPAADVAPVVHGRWIEKSAPARKIYFECSHCGAQENKHTAIKGYYCWRCGAKMDGGDSDAAD